MNNIQQTELGQTVLPCKKALWSYHVWCSWQTHNITSFTARSSSTFHLLGLLAAITHSCQSPTQQKIQSWNILAMQDNWLTIQQNIPSHEYMGNTVQYSGAALYWKLQLKEKKKSIQKGCKDVRGEIDFGATLSSPSFSGNKPFFLGNLIGVLRLKKLTSTMRHVCYWEEKVLDINKML